jgi:hypothetical protein
VDSMGCCKAQYRRQESRRLGMPGSPYRLQVFSVAAQSP